MAKSGVDDKARPVRVGEVDDNVDGVIQERVDAVVVGEFFWPENPKISQNVNQG